ncbi:aa3-type cytochrome oxidase subunit CtaJ [Blastococcus sp. SYSU DS0617]
MTVAETILVFVAVPLAIVLALALLTLGPAARNRRPRYKPGQPWNHDPIWFEPHPEATGHGGGHGDDHAQALGSSVYPERYGDEAAATHAVSGGTTPGGLATGATAAPRPKPAGPLGGARGTW